MSSFITANNGAGSTSPVMILGYSTTRDSRNIVRDLIGGGIAVSLIAPRLRSGSLNLFYSDEAQAWTALNLLSNESAYALTDTDRPDIGMTFVVNGPLALDLDDQTRDLWTITLPYQEINT
jgi:hypothetical protein